jgi:hypothetical protein
MRRTLTAVVTCTVLTAGAAAKADDQPDLVTILTAPEAETQLMAMVLTKQAMDQGAKAHILLCGPGGDVALQDAPASATAPQEPRGMSPQGLMKVIMAAGGTVEVCAIYLPNKGTGPEVLIDQVGVAKPPAMAARLLADDTRILSF